MSRPPNRVRTGQSLLSDSKVCTLWSFDTSPKAAGNQFSAAVCDVLAGSFMHGSLPYWRGIAYARGYVVHACIIFCIE